MNQRLRFALPCLKHEDPELRAWAINQVAYEAVAMEKALRFYADEENWIDGVCLITDEHQLATIEDNGFNARWALHQIDVTEYYVSQDECAQVGIESTEPDDDGGGGLQPGEIMRTTPNELPVDESHK